MNWATISRRQKRDKSQSAMIADIDSQKSYEKEKKSERRMPWLSEAKKDVVSCEKLRGFANRN